MKNENNQLKIEIFNEFKKDYYNECIKNCNLRHQKNKERNINIHPNPENQCKSICSEIWRDLYNYSNQNKNN